MSIAFEILILLSLVSNRTELGSRSVYPCILYRTRSVYPCILYGRPADQSGYLSKLYPDPHDQCSTSRSWLRLVSWHSFDWRALQRKERSSTNWEWLEKAGLIQDTDMSGYEQIWADMSGYERIWADMSRYERIWADMSWYERICADMSVYEQIIADMSGYEREWA